MSTLQAARLRLETALERLEAALRAGGPRPELAAGETERTLGRDLELLRTECDGLRRALEAAEARNRRLAEAADEVAERLEQSIGELAEMVES
jgi:CHAD domain-containing protein